MLRAQAKDFKAQIKIDLAKDKILEMRLSERIAGLAKVSAEVRSQDTYERDGCVFRHRNKSILCLC